MASQAVADPLGKTSAGKHSVGKIGMWIFVVSDVFMFAGFLIALAFLRGGAGWRCTEALAVAGDCDVPEPNLAVGFALALTAVLAASSFTMVKAARARTRQRTLLWLGLTIAGGALFLCGQAHEWSALRHAGLLFGASHYATTFYVITGFHGAHVLAGVAILAFVWHRTSQDRAVGSDEVAIAGLFWQLVDAIWLFILCAVYLVGTRS